MNTIFKEDFKVLYNGVYLERNLEAETQEQIVSKKSIHALVGMPDEKITGYYTIESMIDLFIKLGRNDVFGVIRTLDVHHTQTGFRNYIKYHTEKVGHSYIENPDIPDYKYIEFNGKKVLCFMDKDTLIRQYCFYRYADLLNMFAPFEIDGRFELLRMMKVNGVYDLFVTIVFSGAFLRDGDVKNFESLVTLDVKTTKEFGVNVILKTDDYVRSKIILRMIGGERLFNWKTVGVKSYIPEKELLHFYNGGVYINTGKSPVINDDYINIDGEKYYECNYAFNIANSISKNAHYIYKDYLSYSQDLIYKTIKKGDKNA